MSMCRVISWVVRKGCFLLPECSIDKTANLCPPSFCTPRPNLPVNPGIFWPLILHSYPLYEEKFFLSIFLFIYLFVCVCVCVCVCVNSRSWRCSLNQSTSASSSLVVTIQAWITVMLNGLSWKQIKIILAFPRLYCRLYCNFKYYISDSFADYEGYSISSMGFLPIVVDRMVIIIKFAHSRPF